MNRVKIFILSFILLFFILPLHVNADAEKIIEVEIPKDYISAVFMIKFDSSRNDCLTTIISPDGLEYPTEYSGSNSVKGIVNNVKSGKWKIKITSMDGSDIGTVNVTVEGSKSQVVNNTGDIKVAADITGLLLYLKDDNLIVEWNDNSCGAVKITVSDGLTLQILENDTVSSQDPCYYSFEIPEDREQLLVTVVPSTSASISGAAKSFTLSTHYQPDASVSFGGDLECNMSSMDIHVNLNDTYKVLCYANDKLISESEFLSNGSYDFPVPVAAGMNNYKAYIMDKNHNMRSFSFSCVGDFIAPQLSVDGGSRSVTVKKDSFPISGNVSDFNTLTINGVSVDVYGDGNFEYEYLLHEGDNQINIIASDSAGNISKCEIVATYVIPDYTPVIIGSVCFVCAILLILVLIVALKKFKKMKSEPSTKKVKCKTPNKSGISQNSDKAEKHKNHNNQPKLSKVQSDYKRNHLLSLFGFAAVVCGIFILTRFMLLIVVIQSESMEPTLMTGDIAIFNRLAYVTNEVQIGDIVCIWSEEEQKYLGKRVIGLPGDDISFIDGNVVINGIVLDESLYINEDIETNCTLEFKVPENCYFVLGDNREISKDSRFFDNPYISEDDIVGKYIGFSGINTNF